MKWHHPSRRFKSVVSICQFVGLFSLSTWIGIHTEQAQAAEWSGWVDGEIRAYGETGEQVGHQVYPSMAMQLDYANKLNDDNQLTASLFGRGDTTDSQRNLFDIRELLWLHSADNYQFRAGVGQVSWGVNEIFKITDVINQKDRAEIPFPRKLGQPLMSLSFYHGDDLIELYALYGLRKAWFPGEDGRLRYPILVDPSHAEYDWGATGQFDFAGRWKTHIGDLDLAFSHFYGMSRDPYFIFNYDFNHPYLIPVYEKVNQSSMEMQYDWHDVLFKGEAMFQTGSIERYGSIAGGFEYTFGSIFNSGKDLTWYVEGIWDSRHHVYTSLFDHDVGIVGRLAFNDTHDSNLALGVVADTHYNEMFGTLFWTSTFGEAWSLNVTGQYFMGNGHRYDPQKYVPFFEQFVQENPVSQASVDKFLSLIGTVTISEKQYERLKQFIDDAATTPNYWNGVDVYSVPQTLFDLLRVSDNSQKMNLIERDSYIQVDVYYHF